MSNGDGERVQLSTGVRSDRGMGSEWSHMPLADAIEIISGGTPKTTVNDYWNGDIPWLSVADFNKGYRWVSTAEKHITDLGLAESATNILHKGDIIISARGTVGVLAQLAKPMAFNQSCYGIRGKTGITDNDYLFYALRQAVVEMKQVAHGGVFDTITRDTFKILKVPIPPLPKQRAIAHILGTLDDKIELNRRMNQTLESIARTIFKSWFVDFDPVRAKAEGRPTGLPDEINGLFPDSFEDSELGEIPKGWAVGVVSDLSNVTSGKRPLKRSKEKKEGFEVPLYGGAGIMAYVTDPMITEAVLLTGRVGTLGKIFRISEAFWPSDNTLLIYPKDMRSIYFLFFMLHQIDFNSLNRGSTQPLVTQSDLKKQLLIIPNEIIINTFWEIVDTLFKKLDQNTIESDTLTTLRDTLLPKLISGELCIHDGERFIEEDRI